jgi:hypothetical protein
MRRFPVLSRAALAGFALAGAVCVAPALAQDGGVAAVPLEGRADGAPISRVDVVLTRSSGNPARDQAAVVRLRASLAKLEGRTFSRALVERELGAARGRLGPGRIDFRLVSGTIPGTLGVLVELDTAGTVAGEPPAASGALLGERERFPVLYRSDRAFLTLLINGGFGLYADPNPWFGQTRALIGRSPLAGRLPGSSPAWTEGFIEYGLAGATQLGDSPFYAYGALTGITSWSLGQDIYRADARSITGVEKAYAGLLYIDPNTGGSLNVSVGRQNFTLNDGFLIHFVRGSGNIGQRGGTYLGPRNASAFSAIADGTLGPWSFKAFYIDPNELPLVDSRTTFAGLNLRYQITPTLSVDGSFIAIPESGASLQAPGGVRLPKEGLRTIAGHVRWNNAFQVEGLWLGSELAHQTSDRFAMSAWSGYGLIGYQAAHLPWSPSLSYRYSHASGDNPRTARYERFDPLLSTGLGNWLQGVTFGKLTSNSNLAVHRLQFNLQPTPALNLTFDWHLLRAPERNNLGSNPVLAQLSSHDIGQEFTTTLRWAINRNLFLQSLVSVAVPGRALRDAGATKNWTTLQSSLYWTF